jgi:hypothetical protein
MKLLTLSLVLLPLLLAPVAADQPTTTTTTSISLAGVINCQAILVTAQRVQTATLQTTVDFSVTDCPPGSTVPSHVAAFFHSAIPNADLTLDRTAATLRTASPYGLMTVQWAIAKELLTTYDATWRIFTTSPPRTQTQHDEFQSVTATGTVGSTFVIAQRTGQFSTSVFVDHRN